MNDKRGPSYTEDALEATISRRDATNEASVELGKGAFGGSGELCWARC